MSFRKMVLVPCDQIGGQNEMQNITENENEDEIQNIPENDRTNSNY